MLVNFALVSFLRGIGDTRTPMYLTLAANVLNIALDYWLILAPGGPALGAAGAALGSVLATGIISAAYLVFFFTGERHRRFRTRRRVHIRWKEWIDFFKVGLPIGLHWAMEMISWLVFMAIVSRFSVYALAATEVVFEVLHLSFQGAIALGTAATTLVGQYLGANRPGLALNSARSTLISSILYCVAMGTIFLVFRRFIMEQFSDETPVIEAGCRLFIYAFLFQFFDGLAISCSGVIRGAGDTRWPMIFMLVAAWGFFLPFTYLLTTRMTPSLTDGIIGAAVLMPLIVLGIVLRARGHGFRTLILILLWGGVLTGGYFATLDVAIGLDGAWTAATGFIIFLGVGLFFRYRSRKWLGMRVK